MIVLYSTIVVLSACLLFLVQPLIAKIILPWYGGASSVWSAALVFFQACVLGGYSYAHWLTTHVRARLQGLIHATLLLASCALMPILPSQALRPTAAQEPAMHILLLLAATVGLPAVALCSTSPLVHVWYMRRTGGGAPYWLFALSNLGSLLALLSFPFLLEPLFGSRAIALGWSAAFIGFAALCIAAAWMSRRGADPHVATPQGAEPAPRLEQMTWWMLLAACASALLVSITAHLSTNVAPIPLLWVVPLALYLLTFILPFASDRIYSRTALFPWLVASLGCVAYLYVHGDSNLHIRYVIPLYLIALFVCCLSCHGELAFRRPPPRYLTRFYLLIALGGVLGGAFVALLAPQLFDTYLEIPLLLVLIAAINTVLQWRRRGSRRTLWPLRAALLAGVSALTVYLARAEIVARNESLHVRRNFYGVLRVRDENVGTRVDSRLLVHGTISHGAQYLHDEYRYTPGSYFSEKSAVGRALRMLQGAGPIRLGVIGLGAGVLSSYARAGDYVRIYEIDPDVLDIANQYFSFLARARELGADLDVRIGDARLVLEREPAQQFDLLAVDAFSSDAIPAHLLTNEAADIYFKHLKPNGVLAIHISNRYLDLTPVCARLAERVGRSAVVLRNPSDGMASTSVWVLITSNTGLLTQPAFIGADVRTAVAAPEFPGWSDEFSSLWAVFDWRARL